MQDAAARRETKTHATLSEAANVGGKPKTSGQKFRAPSYVGREVLRLGRGDLHFSRSALDGFLRGVPSKEDCRKRASYGETTARINFVR